MSPSTVLFVQTRGVDQTSVTRKIHFKYMTGIPIETCSCLGILRRNDQWHTGCTGFAKKGVAVSGVVNRDVNTCFQNKRFNFRKMFTFLV